MTDQPTPTTRDANSSIARWQDSSAPERANYQLFLSELCDLLGVPRPDPAVPDDSANAYVFEKTLPTPHGMRNFMDLYKRGCFVLEAKQCSEQPGDESTFSAAALAKRQRCKRGTAVRGPAGWDTTME